MKLFMNLSDFTKTHIVTKKYYWTQVEAMSSMQFPFEITAQEFLAFSNRDLSTDGKHSLVNALSNAKRSIDCQIDAVIATLDIKKDRSFPRKVDNFTRLGLIAPRIIKRINQQRNYLEHEYKVPELERVEDAVDTAQLFVEVTQRVFRQFPLQYSFGSSDKGDDVYDCGLEENRISVDFIPDDKICIVTCFVDKSVVFEEEVDKSKPYFIPLLKAGLMSDWAYSDMDSEEIVRELLGQINP